MDGNHCWLRTKNYCSSEQSKLQNWGGMTTFTKTDSSCTIQSGSPALSAFTKSSDGYWMKGSNHLNNICNKRYDHLDKEACAKKCLDFGDNCLGFEVYQPTTTCYHWTKSSEAELKAMGCTWHANTACHGYTRKPASAGKDCDGNNKAPGVGGYTLIAGCTKSAHCTDYYAQKANTPDAAVCAEICNQDSSCKAFSWNTANTRSGNRYCMKCRSTSSRSDPGENWVVYKKGN